jgi:Raf kinase inhibitor-like YbhB/YbcL family protein
MSSPFIKRIGLFIVAVLVLFVAGIAFTAWRASGERSADAAYHAALAKGLQVSSAGFEFNGVIPASFTCKGGGKSPPLEWSGAPAGTLSFAVMLMDWDAPSPMLRLNAFSHWVLYNIPATETHLDSAATSATLEARGITVGKNSADEVAYEPPCPPMGTHRYVFRVYALDTPKIEPQPDDRSGVLAAMQRHVLASGEFYGRSGQ